MRLIRRSSRRFAPRRARYTFPELRDSSNGGDRSGRLLERPAGGRVSEFSTPVRSSRL